MLSRTLSAFALRASLIPTVFHHAPIFYSSSLLSRREYSVQYTQLYTSQQKRPTKFIEHRVRQEVVDKDRPDFQRLGLSAPMVDGLKSIGIETPTHIQEITITALQRPANYAVASHTGSGKTLAYLLPLAEHLRAEAAKGFVTRPRRPRVLVLGPTKELTDQIGAAANRLYSFSRVTAAVLNGGKRVHTQKSRTLLFPTDIAVATPTRLIDLLRRRAIFLDDVRWLVIDEADTMLAQGWREEVQELVSKLKHRPDSLFYTLLISASWPKEIRNVAKQVFPTVRVLETDSLHRAAPGGSHVFAPLGRSHDKKHFLEEILKPEVAKRRRILVFCNTLPCARAVEHFLNENDIAAVSCNGAMPLPTRRAALRAFTGEEFMDTLVRRRRLEERETNRRRMAEAGVLDLGLKEGEGGKEEGGKEEGGEGQGRFLSSHLGDDELSSDEEEESDDEEWRDEERKEEVEKRKEEKDVKDEKNEKDEKDEKEDASSNTSKTALVSHHHGSRSMTDSNHDDVNDDDNDDDDDSDSDSDDDDVIVLRKGCPRNVSRGMRAPHHLSPIHRTQLDAVASARRLAVILRSEKKAEKNAKVDARWEVMQAEEEAEVARELLIKLNKSDKTQGGGGGGEGQLSEDDRLELVAKIQRVDPDFEIADLDREGKGENQANQNQNHQTKDENQQYQENQENENEQKQPSPLSSSSSSITTTKTTALKLSPVKQEAVQKLKRREEELKEASKQMHSANTELEKAIKQKKSRQEAEDDAAEKLGLHLTPLWDLRRQLQTQFEREFVPPVMVATDIAARGLDFDCKVDLVVNYDFPYNSIDYLHRTGRTARAGQNGKIVSLISKYDTNLATQIQDAIKRDLPFDTIGSDHYLLERRERERLMEGSQKVEAGAGEGGRGKGESENKRADERNSRKAGGDQKDLISAETGAAAALPLMGARKVAGDRDRGGAVASKRSETANKGEKDVANGRSADAENNDNRSQVQHRKATEPKTRGRAKAENDKVNRKNWDRKMWAPMTAAIEAAAAMVKEKPQPYSRRERFSEAGKEDNGRSR